MAKINDIHSIVVPAENPKLNEHVYTEIYGGTDGCVIVVNDVNMKIAGSSNISLRIRTVSGGTGCYLLGENLNVFTGSPTF